MLPILLIVWLLCAFMGAYVAQCKGRVGMEGAVFGFALGPIGILIEALMPSVARAQPSSSEPEKKPDVARPKPLVSKDDVAMDFVMDMVKQGEKKNRSIRIEEP